ncbi:MAG: hypothetical protein SchgKO_12280 [Schleiferiaceae bacterium]
MRRFVVAHLFFCLGLLVSCSNPNSTLENENSNEIRFKDTLISQCEIRIPENASVSEVNNVVEGHIIEWRKDSSFAFISPWVPISSHEPIEDSTIAQIGGSLGENYSLLNYEIHEGAWEVILKRNQGLPGEENVTAYVKLFIQKESLFVSDFEDDERIVNFLGGHQYHAEKLEVWTDSKAPKDVAIADTILKSFIPQKVALDDDLQELQSLED